MKAISQTVLVDLLRWERSAALAAAYPVIKLGGLSSAVEQGLIGSEDIDRLARLGLAEAGSGHAALNEAGRTVCYALAEWFEQHHRPWDLMRDSLPPLRNRRLLDLGCGEGFLVVHALRHGAALAAGIDRLGEMTDFAQAALTLEPPERRGRGLIVQGGAEALPFDRAGFDLMTARVAFNFFELPLAVPEMARVLAPGGEVYMTIMGPKYYARKLFSSFPPKEASYAMVALANAVPTFFGRPAWRFRLFGRNSITSALTRTALDRWFRRHGLRVTSIRYGRQPGKPGDGPRRPRSDVYLVSLKRGPRLDGSHDRD